jgi:predicted helicase
MESFPPLQSMTDEIPGQMATLLRKALPAQAIAIAGLAKYLKTARSARIVAECGTGKTFMSLVLIPLMWALDSVDVGRASERSDAGWFLQ